MWLYSIPSSTSPHPVRYKVSTTAAASPEFPSPGPHIRDPLSCFTRTAELTPMASAQPAEQTLVLRVSIHCHGCKKKVRKVLKSIQGVQDVEVDAQQHKVLVTGTVDAETLVKRLCKSGKQALPWQHTPAAPAPATDAPAPAPPAEDGSEDASAADKKPAEPVEDPQADSSDKKPEQETAPEKTPETEKEAESEKTEEAKPSDEAKKDGEPKAEDTKEASDDEGEAKKKQSKPDDAPAADRSLSPAPAPAHAHQEFNPYNAPQPVMSYHAAQPGASMSYYAPQPQQGYSMRQQPPQPQPGYSSQMQHPPPASQQAQPMQQQWSPSYLYMPYPHASPESYYQDYYSPPGTHAPPPPPPPLQDSYRLLDDENPNACSVM